MFGGTLSPSELDLGSAVVESSQLWISSAEISGCCKWLRALKVVASSRMIECAVKCGQQAIVIRRAATGRFFNMQAAATAFSARAEADSAEASRRGLPEDHRSVLRIFVEIGEEKKETSHTVTVLRSSVMQNPLRSHAVIPSQLNDEALRCP